MIEKDDFESWRDNPITQAVFEVMKRHGEEAKAKWLTASWEQGSTDPALLADLRARAEVCEDYRNITLEDLETWLNGDESKPA